VLHGVGNFYTGLTTSASTATVVPGKCTITLGESVLEDIMHTKVKVKVKLPTKTYRGVGVWVHAVLTSALDGGD
jgi:hypothetical protein